MIAGKAVSLLRGVSEPAGRVQSPEDGPLRR
jgi:hypothetical protein